MTLPEMEYDRAARLVETGALGARIPGETQMPGTFESMTRILRAMPDTCTRLARERAAREAAAKGGES